MAPPKPMHLNRNLSGLSGSPPKPSKPSAGISSNRMRPSTAGGAGKEEMMSAAVNIGGAGEREAMLQMTPAEKDDYIRDFQKRFPSLGAIEMVERDFGEGEGNRGGR